MKKLPTPEIDYRRLRPGNLCSKEFRHLWLLLYWPLYGLLFYYVELAYPVDYYFPVYSPLDDLIPFNELFVIPYTIWFAYLAGMVVYSLFYDVDTFKRYMWFIMITYTVTIVIYLIFPTCQNLRPEAFARDNALTRFMAGYYATDTNTNVCPSIHVLGSLAVTFAAWHCYRLQRPVWKWSFGIMGVLIAISTVFVKQHSIIDVFAALPLCLFAWWLCFLRKKKPKRA